MTTLIEMPSVPKNGSPIPHLTSIHAARSRGPYGSSQYRGNCGGYLIKDLIQYYGATHVLDPMKGSGTCQDVCRELQVACTSMEIQLCGQSFIKRAVDRSGGGVAQSRLFSADQNVVAQTAT